MGQNFAGTTGSLERELEKSGESENNESEKSGESEKKRKKGERDVEA
jgi:hypothetical protein